jgi:hypothetical protein
VLQAKRLIVEAGDKGRTLEFTLAVRTLIQIKTPWPAGDSEPAVARISCCGDAKPNGILHLAVSWGSQPSRRAGASLSAPRAPLIAPRAIRRGVAPEVVGVKKNR